MGNTNLRWMFWMYDRGMKLTITIATVLQAIRRLMTAQRRRGAY